METFFQNLAEEFEDKGDPIDDMEEEVKSLSKIKIKRCLEGENLQAARD